MDTNKVVSKKSNIALYSLSITIIVLIFVSFSFVYIVKDIEKLTKFINSSGVIRGGIQRVTKIHIMEKNYEESKNVIINNINMLERFINTHNNIFDKESVYEFINLKNIWSDYIIILNKNDKEEIFKASEEIWQISNTLVNKIEEKSLKYLAMQYLFLIMIVIVIILLVVIVIFIRKNVQGNIEKKASHDPLTNLLNRNYLNQIYKAKMDEDTDKSNFIAVIMCDIDHFKQINDKYGHDVGDKVLQKIANILLHHTRENDAVFRYGGEEFLILVTFKEVSKLIQYAERIRLSVESAEIIEKKVTISIGVSIVFDRADLKQYIIRADSALYKAKNEGRNRIVISEINLTNASTG